MAYQFGIALAENRQVFQPGETISGVLLLNTNEEIKLRGICINLHGHGRVKIRSGKVTYVRNETYLSYQSILLGRGRVSHVLSFYHCFRCLINFPARYLVLKYRFCLLNVDRSYSYCADRCTCVHIDGSVLIKNNWLNRVNLHRHRRFKI